MAVSARFYVQSIVTTEMSGAKSSLVKFNPDYKDGANRDWAIATPSGHIELAVKDGSALEFFREHIGKGIHITFDEVIESA